ncbi:MAG: hypothetical protein NT090_26990 [Acidobacteria bacterium]|nr:hypothetical protein [Acidobacteriota bacterium]
MLRALVLPFIALSLAAAQKYQGPRPPKPDLPYLLHASRLVETEVAEAREEKRKDDTVYVISGASSPARTPLAEPILLVETEKLQEEEEGRAPDSDFRHPPGPEPLPHRSRGGAGERRVLPYAPRLEPGLLLPGLLIRGRSTRANCRTRRMTAR